MNFNLTEMIKTENKLDLSVEEIMTKQVHTVDAGDKMADVRKTMSNHHIRHAPVLKKGKLVGILSMTDVQRMTFSATYGEDEAEIDDTISDMFTAELVMHRNPVTLNFQQSIKDAAEIFIENEFHALPVLQDDKLVGIVTTTDILSFIVKLN